LTEGERAKYLGERDASLKSLAQNEELMLETKQFFGKVDKNLGQLSIFIRRLT